MASVTPAAAIRWPSMDLTELTGGAFDTSPSGQKTALIAKDGELTFSQVNEKASWIAGHLQAEGIKPGDRVGLFLLNSIAFALCYYAIQSIGAVSVVLDARLKGKELSGVLQDADLNLCITHQRLMPEISPI